MGAVDNLEHINDEQDIDHEEEYDVLIPEGTYEVKCCKHEAKTYFSGAKKLKIVWEVVSPLKHAGVKVESYCNYEYKKFPKKSKYWGWWVTANNNIKPPRPYKTWMTPRKFEGKVFEVYVEVIKPKFKNGQIKPEVHHYSLVTDLISITVGGKNE
jgi:hypothetical protein